MRRVEWFKRIFYVIHPNRLDRRLSLHSCRGPRNLFGLLTGVASGIAAFLAARRARLGKAGQAVHEKRLEAYPLLVKATSRLAIYFPDDEPTGKASIEPDSCKATGREMSQWYFEHGGLLLSDDARNAYFKLARALTRAALAKNLNTPTFPDDAEDISMEKIGEYERKIKEMKRKTLDLDNVENWEFGGPALDGKPNYLKFKDYIFLRSLSSKLRTMLSEDLLSRRRRVAALALPPNVHSGTPRAFRNAKD